MGLFALVAVLAFSAFAGSAAAVEAKPGWESNTRVYPTHLKPGGKGIVEVQVFNTGAGSTTGPVTVTDTLPAGLEATEAGAIENFGEINRELVEGYEEYDEEGASVEQLRVWDCTGTTVVTCHTGPGARGVERPIHPGFAGRIGIKVNVVGTSGAGTNRVTVSGGGAPSASERTSDLTISPDPAGFGLAGQFDGWFTNADGTPDTQAGSHPYELTLNFAITTPSAKGRRVVRCVTWRSSCRLASSAIRMLCRSARASSSSRTPKVGARPTRRLGLTDHRSTRMAKQALGTGGRGFPCLTWCRRRVSLPSSGSISPGTDILIDFGVRSGSDYGITGTARNLGQQPVYNSITFWGMPTESTHDFERCGRINEVEAGSCGYSAGAVVPKPLLTLPTSCEGPLNAELTIDSWNASLGTAKETFEIHDQDGVPTGFTGCEHLGFSTQLNIAPDTSFADTPAGLTVDIKVPQEDLSNPMVSRYRISRTLL